MTEHTEEYTVEIPRRILERYSPEAALFPQISSGEKPDNPSARKQVDVLDSLLAHPSLDEEISNRWRAVPHRELDRTYDSDRFVEDAETGEYPVYGGKNIYQFVYNKRFFDVKPPDLWSVEEDTNPDVSAKSRIREKEVRTLKSAIYDAFDGTGSQKGFVNNLLEKERGEPLSKDDVRLDCTMYRIVFRDIANMANERTLIAVVIPPDIVCHSKLRTIRPLKIDPDEEDLRKDSLKDAYKPRFTESELFAVLGLLNCLPFDYLMRTKIDNTIVAYKFRESQMPRLTAGDDWFEYISSRAARLNCYGDEFAEMRERLGGIEPATDVDERTRLQAEIDAAAFHAYGLNREETAFVLDDFHRVRDPRLMTEDYFDLVLERYDELADEGPMP